MIVMAAEALKAIGLRNFKIDIGDVGFLRIIIERLSITEPERLTIRDAIAIKDTSGLDEIISGLGNRISEDDRKLLLNLTTFYGEEEVISKESFTTDPRRSGRKRT